MSLRSVTVFRTFLLVVAGLIMFAYTWFGAFGLWFFSGRLHTAVDVIVIGKSLLAFPLFLIVFWYARLAAMLLWIYIACIFILYSVISWPSVDFGFLSSQADQALVTAVVLVQIAVVLKNARMSTRTL